MKPFDLEAAKKGAPLQYRDALPHTRLVLAAYIPEAVESQQVIVRRLDNNCLIIHNSKGKSGIDDSLDLLMAPVKKKITVYLYKDADGHVYVGKTELIQPSELRMIHKTEIEYED